MKVLQHVKTFRTAYAGVERVVEELVPPLNAYPDLEVDVLCQGPENLEYALPGGGRVFQGKIDLALASAAFSWRDFRTWQRIAAQYDIVHVHLPWPQCNLNLLLKRFDGAVVVHWHSDIVRQQLLYRGYRWLERWLLQRADRILVTSPKLLAESPALDGVRDKALAVPIGIAESVHVIPEDEVRAMRDRYAGRPLVFALGRLVPYKGFEYLVRSAARLGREAVVLLGGSGPMRGELEALVRELRLEGRVELLGRVDDREMEVLMRACDVFCLPSVQKSEAFGIVQLEAMRAGRPVVSTRITGSGVDWVNQDGETGMTVEPRRPEALAEALNQLIESPELARRLGANGRRRYEEHFTERRMAELVRAAYLRLRPA